MHKNLAVNIVILALVAACAFTVRLFAVIRFESLIHEFDPWFNFRSTKYLIDNGPYKFQNWFDTSSWFPLGRVVGNTVYPGLMYTIYAGHILLNNVLKIGINVRDMCVLLAPSVAGLTSVSTFLLTKEVTNNSTAGLLAAAFMGIAPGYAARSVAGAYDNEAISIFLMVLTFYLWLRALRIGSVFSGILAAAAYGYMVAAWGGYIYITNLLPLHVFILVLMDRFDLNLYTAYSSFYIFGTLLSMQVTFVGTKPFTSLDQLPAFGVFGLLQLIIVYKQCKSLFKNNLKIFKLFLGIAVVLSFTMLAKFRNSITPVAGRFISLWSSKYAKDHLPLVSSIAEHQPTPWSQIVTDVHILSAVLPVGVYICTMMKTNASMFMVVYAVTSTYFAAAMIRLVLTMTPAACVMGGIALSSVLEKLKKLQNITDRTNLLSRVTKLLPSTIIIALLATTVAFALHSTFIIQMGYSHPTVVMVSKNQNNEQVILDDIREAYAWFRENTSQDARILSWWDYGYQIAGMSNRTTIVDNNTWNNTHIALVGKVLSSDEATAYKILRDLGVGYILVWFGGLTGFSGDDMNKLPWINRIAHDVFSDVPSHPDLNPDKPLIISDNGPRAVLDSLLYKMSYYKVRDFGKVQNLKDRIGFDRMRQAFCTNEDISFKHIKESYTTKNWIVRIYRVLPETVLS